ncbi:MAG: DUF418 domain-containing protein, partial [Silvibacterium sp.]|nr:DUF418 domain-containing protein [Silvibacterium sp.]
MATAQNVSPAVLEPVTAAIPAAPPDLQPAVVPVREDERIFAVDTVRGFALLGILLMNICAFGLPEAAYSSPTPAGGATGLNLFTWCFITIIGEGKMRAIFSLTFGASVYLLIDRLSRKGAAADAADIHYRRMLWLLLFGMIHAYLIWWGDILFPYAMMGLLLYPLRKRSPRVLLIVAGLMMLTITGTGLAYHFHIKSQHREYLAVQADEKAGKKLTKDQEATKKDWEQTVSNFSPSAEDLKKETDAHLGSYARLFQFRAKLVYHAHSFPIYVPFFWFDILDMMLIGIALIKLGVLSGDRSTRFYIWMALIGFAIGLPAHSWSVWYSVRNHFTIDSQSLGYVAYEFGRFTAFGYIALLILAIKLGALRPITRTLAAAGRMAFSNYILTSLICTTIFEGYGFALFGKLQRYQLYGVVLFVWIIILIWSPIWL